MTDTKSIGTIPGEATTGSPIPGGNLRTAARPLGFLEDARAWIAARSFAVVTAVAIAAVLAGQLVEDLADADPVQMLPPDLSVKRWTVIIVVVYMLFIVEVVRREARDALAHLRPAVQIDEGKFQAYTRRMSGRDTRLELLRLLASALIVTLLFPILNWALPTVNDPKTGNAQYLPGSVAAAFVVVVGYTVVGWAGLRLVSSTIRLARALGQLSRESVTVNVFDIRELLPFGRIALAGALAPAGLIVIFLLGLGTPKTLLGWAVLMLATSTSILALVLPLRGIHSQMRKAKDDALMGLNQQLTAVHADVSVPSWQQPGTSGQLNERTSVLVALRKVVSEMPTWPFRDTVAFGRAVLLASAPVIYALLNGVIAELFVKRIAPVP